MGQVTHTPAQTTIIIVQLLFISGVIASLNSIRIDLAKQHNPVDFMRTLPVKCVNTLNIESLQTFPKFVKKVIINLKLCQLFFLFNK